MPSCACSWPWTCPLSEWNQCRSQVGNLVCWSNTATWGWTQSWILGDFPRGGLLKGLGWWRLHRELKFLSHLKRAKTRYWGLENKLWVSYFTNQPSRQLSHHSLVCLSSSLPFLPSFLTQIPVASERLLKLGERGKHASLKLQQICAR